MSNPTQRSFHPYKLSCHKFKYLLSHFLLISVQFYIDQMSEKDESKAQEVKLAIKLWFWVGQCCLRRCQWVMGCINHWFTSQYFWGDRCPGLMSDAAHRAQFESWGSSLLGHHHDCVPVSSPAVCVVSCCRSSMKSLTRLRRGAFFSARSSLEYTFL